MIANGQDYTVGLVSRTGGSGLETCTVPVTFLSTLPGARKDAVQLMAGSTILAYVTFSPTKAQSYSGTITVAVSSGGSNAFRNV